MNTKYLLIVILLIITLFSVSCSKECPNENCKSTEVIPQLTYPSPDEGLTGELTYPAPNQTQLEISNVPEPPSLSPAPQPGMASISGLIYSYTTKIVIPETLFYLTPALGNQKSIPHILNGPDPNQGDIQSLSDEKGQFVLDNIPPGTYYLIVWAPYSWSVGELLENDIPRARLIELNPDQSLALGIVYVEWP